MYVLNRKTCYLLWSYCVLKGADHCVKDFNWIDPTAFSPSMSFGMYSKEQEGMTRAWTNKKEVLSNYWINNFGGASLRVIASRGERLQRILRFCFLEYSPVAANQSHLTKKYSQCNHSDQANHRGKETSRWQKAPCQRMCKPLATACLGTYLKGYSKIDC